MKFMMFTLPSIPATFEERKALRPIGRNTERYQMMIDELRKLVVLADEAGFDCFSTTEHHLHSEGYEASVAPLMLYTDFAARTKRIKFSPLGLVLPAWDPIRAAEEIAVLDQLTQGRVFAGFARGYQDRWVNILGQAYHVTGAPMDGSAIDAHNREVYQEMIQIIKAAWTQEKLTFDGKYYKIPNPYEEGITRWPAAEWTREYGHVGEIDDNGVIRSVSVIPRPYQDPHPRLFAPFSVSETTIRYTAAEDIIPWILISYPDEFKRLCGVYRDVAAESGRELKLGQNVGAFRSVHFGDTEQEALDLLTVGNYAGFYNYFSGFGFWEAFRFPEDEDKYPLDPYTPLPKEEWTMDRMRNVKYALAGTPDDIKREIDALVNVYGAEGGELDWFGWYIDQGFMSWDETQRQVEMFHKHIISEFGD